MKKSRKMLSLLLALVLVVGIFSVSASAIVHKTGTSSTAEDWVSGTRITGTAVCHSDRAVATTSLNKSGATLTASACLDYATPASPTLLTSKYANNTNTAVSVTATASKPSGSGYVAKYAFGGHDENTYGTDHLETVDLP